MKNKFSILIVDLDRMLVRSDLLYESFRAALLALASGRAALKRQLAGIGAVDTALPSFNDAVLDYVRRWRAEGGRTVLVTASDQALANAVAAYLGLFDEIYGSDGSANLKGEVKARFLAQFGDGAFGNMGDARADLPVRVRPRKAITVDAAAAVRVMRSNYEGPASILAELSNRFEARGSGILIGISSVGGERGRATTSTARRRPASRRSCQASATGLRARVSA